MHCLHHPLPKRTQQLPQLPVVAHSQRLCMCKSLAERDRVALAASRSPMPLLRCFRKPLHRPSKAAFVLRCNSTSASRTRTSRYAPQLAKSPRHLRSCNPHEQAFQPPERHPSANAGSPEIHPPAAAPPAPRCHPHWKQMKQLPRTHCAHASNGGFGR